jgi:pantoate--beta-alanine ligase
VDLFDQPDVLRAWSSAHRADGRRVAIVPTMGALHAGHLALIAEATRHADVTIVSIFVNPLQFDRASDFTRYPSSLDADLAACRDAGVDVVYAPTPHMMYPSDFQTRVVPGGLAERLEGLQRPGHFEGVTTVVAKLFGAAVPDVAVFGQKDFQQLAIVRRMAADLDMGIEIVSIPTVREADGLAWSSRNVRLSGDERAAAAAIPRGLTAVVDAFVDGQRDAAQLRAVADRHLADEPRATVDYVEVVDAVTLDQVERIDRAAVVLVAAWFGDVRLIDNALLTP